MADLTTTTTFDALLAIRKERDPDPGGQVKSFTGSFEASFLPINSPVDVAGELRMVDGYILGSLRIGTSAFYLPVSVAILEGNNLNSGTFTFILPESEWPDDLGASNGFFFADGVTGTVDATFSNITLNFANPGSLVYSPAGNASSGTLVLAEVLTPFVPVSYDAPEDFMSFVPDTVNSLTEVEVNRELSPFENWGLLTGIKRLPGEKNFSMGKRVEEARVLKSASSTSGLMNGLTRDLALGRRDALEIRVIDAGGAIEDFFIDIQDSHIRLYNRYVDDENFNLEAEIDLRAANALTLDLLIQQINIQSAVFRAFSLVTNPEQVFSKTLINQTNRTIVRDEKIPIATRFRTTHAPIKSGSLYLSDTTAFSNEVTTLATLNVAGDFFVDYQNGYIASISLPEIDSSISYRYIEFPFRAEMSDVVVNDINSDSFRRHFFAQVAQDIYTDIDDATVDGVPTDEMFEIIEELLNVANVYWGP